MKKLSILMLTVTALFFSFQSEAQIIPLDSLRDGTLIATSKTFTLLHDVSKEIHPDYLDTIGCTMLVTNDLQLAAFSIIGYEVRKCHPYYGGWVNSMDHRGAWLIDYSLKYEISPLPSIRQKAKKL